MDDIITSVNSSSITLTESLANIPGINVAAPIIAIVLALYLALFGYTFKKVTFAIILFLLGFLAVNIFLPQAFDGMNPIIPIAVGIVIGLIFGLVGFKVEQLAIFVAVVYLAYTTLSKFVNIGQDFINFAINGVISVILGGIAINFSKPIFITVSSIYAGSLVYVYLPQLVNMSYLVAIIVAVAVAVLGIGIQYSNNLKED